MGLCPPCSLIAWGTHLPIKLPLRTLSFSALNPLAWVPSQVDSPQESLLWEMNDCPPLQKTLVAHSVRLPPLCKGQKTTDPPETSLFAKGRGGHFPVLTALMVGAVSTAPRQTQAASPTLHPRGPLAAIHFPPGLNLGPPFHLLIPWSAVDQGGMPPSAIQKLLDSILQMVS